MATKKTEKKKKKKWAVPPLRLPLRRDPSSGGDSDSTSSTLDIPAFKQKEEEEEVKPTGARTAPVLEEDYVPACPRCGHHEQVHRWRFWKAWNKYVWHCSFEKPATHDMGRQFCGHMWIEDNREGRCDVCKTRARIQEHGATLGYYCPGCHDFFQ
jgi:predicted RNA-binding Zn-ribbon protein involved in translation (DUF1610 family)